MFLSILKMVKNHFFSEQEFLRLRLAGAEEHGQQETKDLKDKVRISVR